MHWGNEFVNKTLGMINYFLDFCWYLSMFLVSGRTTSVNTDPSNTEPPSPNIRKCSTLTATSFESAANNGCPFISKISKRSHVAVARPLPKSIVAETRPLSFLAWIDIERSDSTNNGESYSILISLFEIQADGSHMRWDFKCAWNTHNVNDTI